MLHVYYGGTLTIEQPWIKDRQVRNFGITLHYRGTRESNFENRTNAFDASEFIFGTYRCETYYWTT